MRQRSFNISAGVIFAAIALLHALRLVYGWSAVINGWAIPLWTSWLFLAVAGYLAFSAYQLPRKGR